MELTSVDQVVERPIGCKRRRVELEWQCGKRVAPLDTTRWGDAGEGHALRPHITSAIRHESKLRTDLGDLRAPKLVAVPIQRNNEDVSAAPSFSCLTAT